MSRRKGCIVVPLKWRKKIESGEMRRKYGLDSSSGSRWAFLRSRGCSDTEAQYIVYKERNIINKKKYTKKEAEIDIINSPFGEAIGWVKNGKLTKTGRDVVSQYV